MHIKEKWQETACQQRTVNNGGLGFIVKLHYDDVIMTTVASQITSLIIVYSIIYSDTDQRKHQSSASLAFVWGIHRDRWIPRTKGQLRGNFFHLMTSSWQTPTYHMAAVHCSRSVLCNACIVYCTVLHNQESGDQQSGRSPKVVALFLLQTLVAI